VKKRELNIAIKLTIVAIITVSALISISVLIWRFLRASDYFKVKEVIAREASAVDLSYLKGKNIFNIDLKNESGYILESFPDCSDIRLIRLLPNKIFVDLIKRKPVALVKLYKYFALDANGVFFYATGEPQELDLPIILGLETKIFGPKPGKKYNIRELLLALNIIKYTKVNRALRNLKIKRIDVTNPSSASIFLPFSEKHLSLVPESKRTVQPEGIEVKLGQDNIKEKTAVLASLIMAARNDLSNINYIDLRFKEPVIKFNDAKSK